MRARKSRSQIEMLEEAMNSLKTLITVGAGLVLFVHACMRIRIQDGKELLFS
jgi:hypothetical protein